MIGDQITKILQEITGAKEINLEFPEKEMFGDYTSNVAMTVFADPKRLFATKKEISGKDMIVITKSPRELAEFYVKKLQQNDNLKSVIDKVEVVGPGFINFWLKKDVLVDNLMQIDTSFGTSDKRSGKTVIIDYSSPNIAKPFGIGHLRSTIIGQALYNLYKALGYEMVGDNHLGDWGTQFGKLLCMIDLNNVTDFDIAKLEELYVEFHRLAESNPTLNEKARGWFKKLEDGNPEAKSIWQKCVEVSLKEFDRVYKLLGVKIDFAFGESYYESEMREMIGDPGVQRLLENGEDGAKIIDLSGQGIETPLMFLKSDGATTYATRDLATLKFRSRKWDPDTIIYEVGAEQTLHFRQIFAAGKLLKLVKDSVKLIHTAHGLYLAPDGKKFSTRKGKTVKLEEVLDEAIERAKKLGNDSVKVAKEVGIGAIKYYDLMHSVQSNVIFDWEKMMNLEGNSGPYLQYTVARTNSVIAKSTFKGGSFKGRYSSLNEEELLVLRSLVKFPEMIELSAKLYAPNLLCNYLYDLAQKFNGFYNADKILGSENEEFRLALTGGVGQVLKNGLKILGIETPEKM